MGEPGATGAAWRPASRALMLGNFAIGTGVMVVPGAMNDLARSLAVSAAAAGQLITVGAITMGLGAPVLAAALGRFDRRRLLTLALAWYAAGLALCALMPGLAALLPVRAACVLGAALFTPQAAAAMNVLAPQAHRGRALTTVFLGWSLASVLGMPVVGYIAETAGWRWSFGAAALLAAVSALRVWQTLPDGVRPPSPTLAGWRRVFADPLLMGMVIVTALGSAGQFTVFAYFAPYFSGEVGARPGEVAFLFFWFGLAGVAGNVLLTRSIDRLGAPRCVDLSLAAIAGTMLLWPATGATGLLAGVAGMLVALTPWGLGCFAMNSAQQARLAQATAGYAPALLALNTSAIYAGQAIGAAGGGALLAAHGFAPLPWAALAWLLLALGLSLWTSRSLA